MALVQEDKSDNVHIDTSNEKKYEDSANSIPQEKDWSDEEERKLVRKLDSLIMVLLILGFFGLQLDRGNIGNALTDFFLTDVGISQFQFNVGQQLLAAGIVILEIPSNLLLYKLGPTVWIGSQMLAWGFVATFQAFQKGLGGFLSTRLLLGLCESGFIPGCLYTITRWYKRDETSKRFSAFFIGNIVAGGTTGLAAYGILQMRGVANLTGWQWMFLIEGIFSILVGIVFICLFPKANSDPVSLLGFRYFNERESHILHKRILLDDPSKVHVKPHITKQEVKNTLTNWRLIPHIVLTLGALSPASTMGAYAPTLVGSFGFPRLKANALVSIGSWMSLITVNLWGYLADRFRARGFMVSLGLFISWALTLGNRLLISSPNANSRFGMLTTALSFGTVFHAVNGSWMSLHAKSDGERSVTMAIFIMSANASGIIGSQLFQAQDGPLYYTGWTLILSLVSLGFASSLVANAQYWFLARRERKRALE